MPTKRTRRRGLAELVAACGMTRTQIAGRTGYSTRTIARVVNGHHPGSRRFHLAMRAVIGPAYDVRDIPA